MLNILEALTIRFTPKSDFLGTGPIVELPPNIYSEISCLHSNEWNARLLRHKEEEDAEHVRKEAHRRHEYVKQNGILKALQNLLESLLKSRKRLTSGDTRSMATDSLHE
jgi:hypothetical protein